MAFGRYQPRSAMQSAVSAGPAPDPYVQFEDHLSLEEDTDDRVRVGDIVWVTAVAAGTAGILALAYALF
jgi:hypothetical protein